MTLQYKAYLVKGSFGKVKEIRRFTIDTEVTSNYDYLKNKVASVFPNINSTAFTLHYQDAESDFISFSSDEELMQALAQISDGLFRLYVKIKKDEKDGEEFCKGWKQPPTFGSGYPHHRFHHPPHPVPPQPPQWYPRFNYAPPHAWGFGPWGHPGQQTQQQQQTPGENAHSTSYSSPDGQYQQQSQSQGPMKTAQDYLNSVGVAVADFLKPLGIDVDVDVEHNGQTTKCSESEIKKKQREEAEKDESQSSQEETPPKPTEERETTTPPAEGEWTVVQDDQEDSGPTEPMTVESQTDRDPRLHSALEQMRAMGFSDDRGWLSRLLLAHDYDIARALDAMQPHHGYRA